VATLRTGLIALLILLAQLGCVASAQARTAYKTVISGVADSDLTDQLEESSELVQHHHVDNEEALRRRAVADLTRLQAVVRAAGYYDAALSFDIDTKPSPWKVTVKIDLGQPYRLREVKLVAPQGAKPPLIEHFQPANVGLKIGKRAIAGPIADAEGKILRIYTGNGWPLAKMVAHEAVIDRADHSMHVTYTIDVGPPARFGPTDISGLKEVEREYVERRIDWREGKPYDSRRVDSTTQSLIDSNLFATVKITPAASVGADGLIPMKIEVTERRQRSVGVGAFYDSSKGPGARVFWEHRNLFGQGELLHLEATGGQKQFGALAQFKRPDFLIRDLDLRSELSLSQENVDAYDSTRGVAFTGVDRRFSHKITGGAGVQFVQAHVHDDTGTQNYSLVGLPLYVRRDDTDDLLNPTRGTRLGLTAIPSRTVDGTRLTFLNAKVTASGYQRLGRSDRFVVAGFGNFGSIPGVSLGELPRDLRLYAGGGGSVRGYGYQMAGPLDSRGNPIGGLSSIETGIELRTKITDTIGIANFIEGGNVYDHAVPDFSENLLWGAGAGLRYYSPFGPVRFDIAFPLNKRHADDPFQFYISLGQAF